MSLLRRLLRRASAPSPQDGRPRLRSGEDVVAHYRKRGATAAAATELALEQVRALRALVRDEPGWERLTTLVARAGDPWNADDWPLGFDALICCASLCTHVDYECRRCPIGQTQEARSCAHPGTAFGTITALLSRGDRPGLEAHLQRLEATLCDLVSGPASR